MRPTIASWMVVAFSLAGVHCTEERYVFPTTTTTAGGSANLPGGGSAGSAGAAGSVASSGSGGNAGGVSSGGATFGGSAGTSSGEPRGPTPAVPGTNFPFPQNRHGQYCTPPSNYLNSQVRAAYQRWKDEAVVAEGAGGYLRVKRLANDAGLEPGSTVSEGIAYGMMIAVYMGDQPLFDELWKYEQLWLNENGLMHWYINAAGTDLGSDPPGNGAASDSDEDMAWALLMADRQWGGSGSLGDTYLNIATGMIDRVWQHEIHDGQLLMPGDSWGLENPWLVVNPSYFAPSYYRAFAEATGNAGWLDVVTTSYDTIDNALNASNGNMTNGLVPAWCTSDGAPNADAFQGGTAPTHYQYDSCRTPFRIGLDYCLHGEARAKAYVEKTSSFFVPIGALNIVDGYELSGAERARATSGQSAAFVGPAVIGAMNAAVNQPFLDEGYAAVASYGLLVGGEYYDGSWTVLSLLMMTGNFLDYTKEMPLVP